MTTYREPRALSPPLPEPRGALSAGVRTTLGEGTAGTLPSPGSVAAADPFGDDLQLALYVLYELHYQGFDGVDDRWEWDPDLLGVRRALEDRFLDAVREGVRGVGRGEGADDALAELLVEPVGDEGTSMTHFLDRAGTREQLREYAALRSLYHLKEGDPHAWVIPRLHGRAKAGMVAVEYDEYGAGRAEALHARLFADLMVDLGLDIRYGRYVDVAPAQALATVNLMSALGLRRASRGALVGHFAAVEVTSSPGSRRLAHAMRRTGAGTAAERFYAEHVEADAVHEQVVRREVVTGLLADEPHLEPDVTFGVRATVFLEDRLAAQLLGAWRAGRSALRRPLPSPG